MNEPQDIEERILWLERREDELRAAGASAVEIEANRLDIIALQWELARLLLAPPLDRAA